MHRIPLQACVIGNSRKPAMAYDAQGFERETGAGVVSITLQHRASERERQHCGRHAILAE